MGEIAANILKISRRRCTNRAGRTHARTPDAHRTEIKDFPVSANTGESAPTPCRFPVDGGCAALRGYLRAFNPLTSIYIYIYMRATAGRLCGRGAETRAGATCSSRRNVGVSIHIYMCIYIWIERERERICTCSYLYIYIYIYTRYHTYIRVPLGGVFLLRMELRLYLPTKENSIYE